MKYVVFALLLSVSSVTFATEDTPFRFCGPVAKMIVNGNALTSKQIQKFKECKKGQSAEELGISVGYRTRQETVSANFKFDDTSNTLHVTLKDKGGKPIPVQ